MPLGKINCITIFLVPEHSNSSWAELEWQIVGSYSIHPLTTETKLIFTLRMLTPLAEFQEFLTFLHDNDIKELLGWCINMRETKNARLAYEAAR